MVDIKSPYFNLNYVYSHSHAIFAAHWQAKRKFALITLTHTPPEPNPTELNWTQLNWTELFHKPKKRSQSFYCNQLNERLSIVLFRSVGVCVCVASFISLTIGYAIANQYRKHLNLKLQRRRVRQSECER